MSFFTVDHSQANSQGDFQPIAEGKYEAIISEAKPTTYASGNEGLKVTLTIRNDVNQPFQKRKVFDNVVQTPKTLFRFQQIAKAVELPQGQPIQSLEAFAKLILNKPVKITIKHEVSEYQGKTRINERVPNYEIASTPYGSQTAETPFDDSDLPFTITTSDLPKEAPTPTPEVVKAPWE
jgi:hypothetical protein